jgi:hypothetical protein
MSDLVRYTVNLPPEDEARLAALLDPAAASRRLLEDLAGEALESRSAELRALVRLGADVVRDAADRAAYDAAVVAGDFDETTAVTAGLARSRRRRGRS